MTISKLLTICILLFNFSLNSYADSIVHNEESTTILHKTKDDSKKDRPRAPLRQHIICSYTSESLYIDFKIPEGESYLIITNINNNDSYTYTLYDKSSIIFIGNIIGTLKIELSTELGNQYEGLLTIQ